MSKFLAGLNGFLSNVIPALEVAVEAKLIPAGSKVIGWAQVGAILLGGAVAAAHAPAAPAPVAAPVNPPSA